MKKSIAMFHGIFISIEISLVGWAMGTGAEYKLRRDIFKILVAINEFKYDLTDQTFLPLSNEILDKHLWKL